MKSMYMKFIILAFISATLFSGQVRAQDISDVREKILIELTRTERLIQQVTEAIHANNNPIAATTLRKARELQEMAKNAFQQRTEIGYRTALNLTLKARELAKAALANSRQTDQFEGAVARKLEHARDMLTRAKEVSSGLRKPELEGLFEAARNNLQRGLEFFRNQQYRPAVKLADQVIKTARRIINAAGDKRGTRLRFERRLEEIQRTIGELKLTLADCESTPAARFLNQAEEALQQAREFGANDRFSSGLRLLQQARSFAQKATQECSGESNLRQRLEQLEAEANRLSEEVIRLDGPRKEAAQRLINQARDQLRLTINFLNDNKFEPARASLKGAQLALRQARKQIGFTE